MIYILSVISVLIVYLFYRKTVPQLDPARRILLTCLRSITIIIVLVLLLNPIIYFLRNRIFQPEIIILNDISESMELPAGQGKKAALLTDFHDQYTAELRKNGFKLIKYDFANGLSNDRSSTYLDRTLKEISNIKNLRDVKGMILLSDGWFKDDDLAVIRDLNIPVFTYVPNLVDDQFDLEITDFKYNRTAFANEITPLVVNLYANNYRGKAELDIIVDNVSTQSREIDFRQDNFQQLVIDQIFEDQGFVPLKVVVNADSTGEINTNNNSISGAIQVVKSRNLILIISDKLTWDTKFMNDALRGNDRWDIEILLRTDKLYEGNKQVRLQDKVQDVSLLILIDNGKLTFLPQEKSIISNYVENGGGLILQGRIDDFLLNYSPVLSTGGLSPEKGVIYFTESSKQFQSFESIDSNALRNLPPLNFYRIQPKTQAQVLARIENELRDPVILFNQNGNSKILYIAFNDLWKWQLWDPAGTFNDFITDICMWIGQKDSERFAAFTEKNSYDPGEIVRIRLQAYDEKLVPLSNLNIRTVIRNEKSKIVYEGYMTESNKEYTISIMDLDPGSYSFELAETDFDLTSKGNFFISENKPESRDRGFNKALMSYLAVKTDGIVYSDLSTEELFIPDKDSRIQSIRLELPVYRKWYIITLFLAAFCLELFLRKRWGLL